MVKTFILAIVLCLLFVGFKACWDRDIMYHGGMIALASLYVGLKLGMWGKGTSKT